AMEEDLPAVLAMQREIVKAQEDVFVRTLPEFDFQVEHASQQLADLLEQSNSLWIVAVLDGAVVGSLDLHGGHLARIMHSAHFGMLVRPDHLESGVSAALLETMLEWVCKHRTLAKVSTTVFGSNIAAIAL